MVAKYIVETKLALMLVVLYLMELMLIKMLLLLLMAMLHLRITKQEELVLSITIVI